MANLIHSSVSYHPPRDSVVSSTYSDSPERPPLERQLTDNLLDYYQSEDAGKVYVRPYPAPSPSASTTPVQSETELSSGSSYSETSYSRGHDKQDSRRGDQSGAPARSGTASKAMQGSAHNSLDATGVHRRVSTRSAGGTDKRRLAIVELDPSPMVTTTNPSVVTTTQNPKENLHERRGMVGHLALVAPPDAAPQHYTDISPPASAPPTRSKSMARHMEASLDGSQSASSGHHRSYSEMQSNTIRKMPSIKKAPRDVGIVGTNPPNTPDRIPSRPPSRPQEDDNAPATFPESATSPIFQRPKDRSPSPYLNPSLSEPSSPAVELGGNAPSSGHLDTTWKVLQSAHTTPAIGEAKDIKQSVAGPVVLAIPPRHFDWNTPTQPNQNTPEIKTTSSSPVHLPSPSDTAYLHYVPGVHSTAGPLPPPPRHIIPSAKTAPPPRPPRRTSPPDKIGRETSPTKRPTQSSVSSREQSPVKGSSSVSRPVQDANSVNSKIEPAQVVHHQPSPSPVTPSPEPLLLDSRSSSDVKLETVIEATREDSTPLTPPIESSTLVVDEDQTPTRSRIVRSDHVREGESSTHPKADTHGSSVLHSSPSMMRHVELPPTPESDLDVVHERKPRDMATFDDLVAAVGEAIDDIGLVRSEDVPPPTVLEPPRSSKILVERRSAAELQRANSWVSMESDTQSTDEVKYRRVSAGSGLERSPNSLTRSLSHSPSGNGIRGTSPMQRISRTASLLSPSRASLHSHSKSRGNSPSEPPIALPPSSFKFHAAWPDALRFDDVLAMRNSADRANAYARKIKELSYCECGLEEWMLWMKARGHGRRGDYPSSVPMSAVSSTLSPAQSIPLDFGGSQPRNVSHGTMASDMTFPTRPEASVAVEIPYTSSDEFMSPISPANSLPYPSLAQGPGYRGSIQRSQTFGSMSPSTSLKPLSSGFFSTIGRKASMKKERFGAFPQSPSNTKVPLGKLSISSPQPRPIKLGPPRLPGGPRSPATRAQRAGSVLGPSRTSDLSSPDSHHPLSSSPTHMSSLPARAYNSPPLADDEFNRQLAKLVDVFPHADRGVLAGYLRRAGQDILAIGQYVEDQKNGTIKTENWV